MKNNQFIIVTSAGFVIGLAEALIYYNMGKKKESDGKFKYTIPPGKELAITAGVVVLTALATAALTGGIEKLMVKKELSLIPITT